jgi:hypothetical protein
MAMHPQIKSGRGFLIQAQFADVLIDEVGNHATG